MEFKETIASFSQILQEFQVPPKMGMFSVQQWKCPEKHRIWCPH